MPEFFAGEFYRKGTWNAKKNRFGFASGQSLYFLVILQIPIH
jgi:hypothetical protein